MDSWHVNGVLNKWNEDLTVQAKQALEWVQYAECVRWKLYYKMEYNYNIMHFIIADQCTKVPL